MLKSVWWLRSGYPSVISKTQTRKLPDVLYFILGNVHVKALGAFTYRISNGISNL
jgi:hypothetical protein